MRSSEKQGPRRELRALGAALLAASLLAGCGGGGAKGTREGGEGVAKGEPAAGLGPSLKQREAASVRREAEELAALKRAQQRARTAREAAEAEAARTAKKKSAPKKSRASKPKPTKSRPGSKSGSAKKKGSETEAERAARKHFEEEEAREAGK
jgi:hypothetical protein